MAGPLKIGNKTTTHYVFISEDRDLSETNKDRKWPERKVVFDLIKKTFGKEVIKSLILAKEDMNNGVDVVFKILVRIQDLKSLNSSKIRDVIKHFFEERDWISEC